MISRYNGMSKCRTKNCDSCPHLRIVNNEERCYWGVAWKPLIPQEKPQKCMLVDKPSPNKTKKYSITQDAFGQYMIYCGLCEAPILYTTRKKPSEKIINQVVKNHCNEHHAQRKLGLVFY